MHRKPFLFMLIMLALASFRCKDSDKTEVDGPSGTDNSVVIPKNLNYSVVASYPHDTTSFTQGLFIHKGELFESTGDPNHSGQSKLQKLNMKTGKAIKSISLQNKYFGEGATIINDTVYQLTWKDRKAFAYTLPDFKKIKEYDVTYAEGWGLTNDGKHLIVSTGGSDLIYYEPGSFKYVKTLTVSEAGTPAFNINELEYIEGYIYANQWNMPYIFKIDPANGIVVAKADVSDLWSKAKKVYPGAEVPNGIAYDAATKKIYITGKWWPELYEIQFSK